MSAASLTLTQSRAPAVSVSRDSIRTLKVEQLDHGRMFLLVATPIVAVLGYCLKRFADGFEGLD